MTLHPKLSQALCVAGLGGPGLASQPWKGLWCNPGEVNRKSCPKGRFFAFVECQHSMGAEALCQSHRRRSPPPPFAQGRLLCPGLYNRPSFDCRVRERSMGPASRWAVWERRHSANPTGGVRRHLPLHKGGFFALVYTTGPGSVAQRGSGPVSGRVR